MKLEKLTTFKLFCTILSALAILSLASTANAAAPQSDLSDSDKKAAMDIAGNVQGVEPSDVSPSLIPGLYQVSVGSQVLYISRDSSLLFMVI